METQIGARAYVLGSKESPRSQGVLENRQLVPLALCSVKCYVGILLDHCACCCGAANKKWSSLEERKGGCGDPASDYLMKTGKP